MLMKYSTVAILRVGFINPQLINLLIVVGLKFVFLDLGFYLMVDKQILYSHL